MFSIDVLCTPAEKDLTIAELWATGSTGIIELSESDATATLRAFFDDDALAEDLRTRFHAIPMPADTRDWVAFAREHLHPMEIGQRIFVIPEWCNDATPPGRIRIEINAGLAFGTGAHETTRLCLQALERYIRPGCTVADVGTGSGILAEAALKLGAGKVIACDTDPEAVTVALENFTKAGIAVPAFIGSADSIVSGVADVIVANISPAWISDLAVEWVRILKPNGMAVLSGFEVDDVPDVQRRLQEAGAGALRVEGENSWRMIQMRKG